MTNRICAVELRLVRLPLVRPFTTSTHTKEHLDHILVRISDASGVDGWGECVSPSDPFYCAETVETCWHMLRDFLVPAVLGRDWDSPGDIAAAWASLRGNHFAKAGLEMACWDLHARKRGTSVASDLGGTQRRILSGVSLGIEPPVTLIDEVERYIGQGYRRIKVKIAPERDVVQVAAIRQRFPDVALMVDANSAYRLDEPAHIAALKELDTFGLMMIEQPLGHDDIVDHARLQAMLDTPICLDESIHTAEDARKAIDLGSCRVVNVKVSRLGGLGEAKRTHDLCVARGVPVWCGGMHEFGIGRAANIAVNSLSGFRLPGDIAGSDKAYATDIVSPPIRAERGTLPVWFDRPGLGVEPDVEAIAARTLRTWHASQ